MQLKQALDSAVGRLNAAQVPSSRLNAESLLMFTLDCDRAYLHAHSERNLSADEQTRYEAALAERARGVPTQYITGHQEFWGIDLIVTPAVLIPRPETEHLIETVLEIQKEILNHETPHRNSVLSASRFEALSPKPTLRLADVGTGSGCIALALSKEFPEAEIHATDISPAALEIARANAARHQLEHRIHFHQADLLASLALTDLDFIVSNPPYVGESEADHVQLEVRRFEPHNAVFAGPTGTEIIARLIPQSYAALQPGGWLVLEISETIAEEVKQLLQIWYDVRITPDLQGIPRIVAARKLTR